MSGFKKDKMSEKERLEAMLNRKPVDRVPLWLGAISFAAATVGYPRVSMYQDPQKTFEAIMRTSEMFNGLNFMFHPGGAFPAREFGGEVEMPTSEYAMAVSLSRPPVESKEDALRLELPDVRTAGQIPMLMDFSKFQKAHDWPVTFFCGGILSSLGFVTSVDRMCRWMIKEPELVHRLCRLVTDLFLGIADYWIETFGQNALIIPSGGAPTESNQIISPKQFEKYFLPYQKEINEKILSMGIKNIFFHICGEQNLNLPYWAQIPMGDPGMISFGHEVDLEKASEYFPEDILVGNINPAMIQTGTPEEVYELSRRCIEKGKKHRAGFALASGCELPPKAPPHNVWMMRKAINDFGWYD